MVAVDLVHKGAVAGLLAAGTLAALIGKGLYQIKARPAPHKAPKYFAKPLASTLAMFIGMFLCLPVWLAVKATRSLLRRGANTSGDSANEEQSQPLLRDHESTWSLESLTESTTAWWHHYAIILIPTIFDLTATILQSVGLLFTTASV